MELQISKDYTIDGSLRDLILQKIENEEEGWVSVHPNTTTTSNLIDLVEQQQGVFRTTLKSFLINSLKEDIVFLGTSPTNNRSDHDYNYKNPFVVNFVNSIGIYANSNIDQEGRSISGMFTIIYKGDRIIIAPNIDDPSFRLDVRLNVIDYENYKNGANTTSQRNTIFFDELQIVRLCNQDLFYTHQLDKKLSEYDSEITKLNDQINTLKNKMSSVALIRDFMKKNSITKEIKSNVKSLIIMDHMKKRKSFNSDSLTEISEIIDINI